MNTQQENQVVFSKQKKKEKKKSMGALIFSFMIKKILKIFHVVFSCQVIHYVIAHYIQ